MDLSGKLVMESILETKTATILQFFAGLCGPLLMAFEEGPRSAWLYDFLNARSTNWCAIRGRTRRLYAAIAWFLLQGSVP